MHPGSPPGWESQRAQWSQLCPICGGAPRQPAGVGVSTNPAMVIGLRGVAPRQPAGGSLNSGLGSSALSAGACTPAARRVGVSTPQDRRSRQSPPVHPGSPPGWGVSTAVARPGCRRAGAPGSPPGWGVSTHLALPARTTAYRAPRQPAGWESQPARRAHADKTGRSCTPAARRGGSLNRSSPSCWDKEHISAPGSPPGGRSQHPPGQGSAIPACAPRQPAGVGSLNTTAGLVAVAVPSAPRQPAGGESQRLDPTPGDGRQTVHPGSPPGWESQQRTLRADTARTAVHPAARRVGVSTRCRRCASRPTNCTRQPAGVGVSTCCRALCIPTDEPCTPAARRGGVSTRLRTVARPRMWRAPRQPAGVGVSTRCWPGIARLRIVCTPAARRGGESQPRHRRRAGSVRHRAPRQPAGVGSLNLLVAVEKESPYLVHPGSPPGWESQHVAALSVVVLLERAPGSPPGWESQQLGQAGDGACHVGAPRQPAGVGVSTCPHLE